MTRPQAAHQGAGMFSVTASCTWIFNSSVSLGELGLSRGAVNNRYHGLPSNQWLETVIGI